MVFKWQYNITNTSLLSGGISWCFCQHTSFQHTRNHNCKQTNCNLCKCVDLLWPLHVTPLPLSDRNAHPPLSAIICNIFCAATWTSIRTQVFTHIQTVSVWRLFFHTWNGILCMKTLYSFTEWVKVTSETESGMWRYGVQSTQPWPTAHVTPCHWSPSLSNCFQKQKCSPNSDTCYCIAEITPSFPIAHTQPIRIHL